MKNTLIFILSFLSSSVFSQHVYPPSVSLPYKVYTALMTQTGTSAPTAKVLQNTLGGTVVWTRNSTGRYTGTLTGAFTADKTAFFTAPMGTNSQYFPFTCSFERVSANAIEMFANDLMVGKNDGILLDVSIEIRVYN